MMAAFVSAVEEPSRSPAGVEGRNRRIAVVVNAGSRSGSSDLDATIERIGASGTILSIEVTDSLPALVTLAEDAANAADILVIGGGDGTVSATLLVLQRTGRTLGVLPLGTANDLARTLGIPFDPVAAAEVIATGEEQSIDLGESNGRPFCNAISIGFAADLAQRQDSRLQKLLGVFHYTFSRFSAYRRFRPFAATLRYDGGEHRFSLAFLLTVANGRHHGGGMTVDDEARIDDATLDVYCLDSVGVWRLMHALFYLRRGKLRQTSHTTLLLMRELEISTPTPLRVTVDGDVRTETPAALRVLPKASRFWCRAKGAKGLNRKG